MSLNAGRVKARDTKRMADLKQISLAIELYIGANGYLPTRNSAFPTTWCTYISNPIYPDFVNDIRPYMPSIPSDPVTPRQGSDYFFRNYDGVAKYALCAKLERATGNTYDYTAQCDGAVPYNYCFFPNG